ncbi:MAG: ASKHA domain-containing protein [Acidobacteriota bacterium]
MAEEKNPQALIVFTPSGKRGRFPLGTPVLQAARRLGVDIDSVCGGRGICGRCQVLPTDGEFAKHGIKSRAEHLDPLTDPEKRYAEKHQLDQGRRLSCHARIRGDVVIDVPASSQVHHQVVRKEYQSRDIEVDPILHLYYTQVQEPDLAHPSGDLQRLLQALEKQWRLTGLVCDARFVRELQRCLREGKWWVTVAVREDRVLVAVWPGFKERVYGVAVDVGSTTVAAHLCDLTSGAVLASGGTMNPQIRFGEDVMSRVSYVMLNPGGDVEMTRAVRETINQLVAKVAADAGIDTCDVLEMTLVGNPIMHHLLLGISPVPLGTAPFALATDGPSCLRAHELDISVHPGARAYVLPCIAGHVGADTAAVILAEAPYEDDEISLIVDVGTNAELVLGNRRRLLAASSPTGPAFEGAQISCGQRAAPGAIERVRIDPRTLEPRFKVIGCDLWSDEPGFSEQVGKTGITGICGSGIIEVIAEMYLAGIINADGAMDGAQAARSPRIIADGRTHAYVLREDEPRLRILQKDVRAIQLAKAALYAGARLLMDHLGVDRVDRIRLAGAFGSHIDVKYAMVLGLIPDCHLERVSSAGNAAGTGAVVALLNQKARRSIEVQVRKVEKVETAVEPMFQEHFLLAMAIPHKTHRFSELAKVVKLPQQAGGTQPKQQRRRGGRRSKQAGAA